MVDKIHSEMYQVGLVQTTPLKDKVFDYKDSGRSWDKELPGPDTKRMVEIMKEQEIDPKEAQNFRFLYTPSGKNIAVYYVGSKEDAKENKLKGFFSEPRTTDRVPDQLEGLHKLQKEILNTKDSLVDPSLMYAANKAHTQSQGFSVA